MIESNISEKLQPIEKIAVIGNSGGGKTHLSRKLAQIYSLPVAHIDSIQFLPGMKVRPRSEAVPMIEKIHQSQKWIIDGFGPLEILEQRLKLADRIVMVDFPIWKHYWWSIKRQITNFWSPRVELPEGCSEKNLAQTIKLFKTIWKVHRKMRPELLKILNQSNFKNKVCLIRRQRDWEQLSQVGFDKKLT